ncbi:MAG: RDD family protein [Luteolibacter sp.]|uniref:RDD family protein n=1 Tax=Luteolibacter sp. TaxID=1962973 RepID=UPI003264C10B
MDQKPEEILDAKAARLAMQNVPPPDMPKAKAVPESPLDRIPKTSPPPPPVRDIGVKVKIRTGDEPDEEEIQAGGLAPFNTRVTAMAIDAVVGIGVIIGLNSILPDFAHKLSWLVALAYIVTRDSLPFLGGQSVGKKAMNLRAVTLDGKPLTGNWEVSLIRNGILLIPPLQLLELWILLTREEKPERGLRLGDEWAKTKVIVEEKPAVSESDE